MLHFTKMHGIGNDYIYVNCFKETIDEPEKLSILLSDRHFGIGSDGLVLICPSEKADFRMKMFNIDGSEGMMCGNASRCIGKYVYDERLTDKTEVTLETKSGIKHLSLTVDSGRVSAVTVDMGKAILTPRDIPVDADGNNFVDMPVEVCEKTYSVTCVSMGNPHCIIFTDEDTESIPLEQIGPHFENHKLFPERINTEFVNILSDGTFRMRVWERGSGETWACGTGACAVAVAAVLNGYAKYDVPVTIHLRGGNLTITYRKDGTVIMSGPATKVFDGEINLSDLK